MCELLGTVCKVRVCKIRGDFFAWREAKARLHDVTHYLPPPASTLGLQQYNFHRIYATNICVFVTQRQGQKVLASTHGARAKNKEGSDIARDHF